MPEPRAGLLGTAAFDLLVAEAPPQARSEPRIDDALGRLVTDQEFRRRFAERPSRTLFELVASGVELTTSELSALAAMDPLLAARLADALDPRIRKGNLKERGLE